MVFTAPPLPHRDPTLFPTPHLYPENPPHPFPLGSICQTIPPHPLAPYYSEAKHPVILRPTSRWALSIPLGLVGEEALESLW